MVAAFQCQPQQFLIYMNHPQIWDVFSDIWDYQDSLKYVIAIIIT